MHPFYSSLRYMHYFLVMLLVIVSAVSARADSTPGSGVLVAYGYRASDPSLQKAYGWATRMFRRTEPAWLDNALVIPVCFSAGRKQGVISCTLILSVTAQGYELKVTSVYHSGNGWVEDRGNLNEIPSLLDWQLTTLRHGFEEWLLTDQIPTPVISHSYL